MARIVEEFDLVHLQNIMNPLMLEAVIGQAKTVVTVQDHRIFCPWMGKVFPDGKACDVAFSDAACGVCLPEDGYRNSMVDLTRQRLEAIRKAERHVVLSEYMRGELELVGISTVEVVPPYVEVEPERTNAGTGWLIAGRFVPHKDLGTAIEAHRLSRTEEPLWMAGKGGEVAGSDRCRHLGWLDPVELRERMRSVRAVLFPSFWQEPFGIVGIQSLACGVPVIAAQSGGMEDWGDAGVIRVPKCDPQAMASAMMEIESDPDAALTLGESGRRSVSEKFGRERFEGQMKELNESLVSPGPKGDR